MYHLLEYSLNTSQQNTIELMIDPFYWSLGEGISTFSSSFCKFSSECKLYFKSILSSINRIINLCNSSHDNKRKCSAKKKSTQLSICYTPSDNAKPHYYFPSNESFPSLIYYVDAASGLGGWETVQSFCVKAYQLIMMCQLTVNRMII